MSRQSSTTVPPRPTATDALRAAGLRVTSGRSRVLEVLRAADRPLSHGEIETAVGGDRVTLYRILDALVGAGLALRAPDERGLFRYSAAGTAGLHADHAHFRCTDCGAVFCLESALPPPPRLPQGFRLADASFDLRGTCAACSRRSRGQ